MKGFSEKTFRDQGLLSRLLVTAPASLAGTRFSRNINPEIEGILKDYNKHIGDILHMSLSLTEGTRNELTPRCLNFTKKAPKAWHGFADYVEELIAPNGSMEPFKDLANKLPEHAARLAGIAQT